MRYFQCICSRLIDQIIALGYVLPKVVDGKTQILIFQGHTRMTIDTKILPTLKHPVLMNKRFINLVRMYPANLELQYVIQITHIIPDERLVSIQRKLLSIVKFSKRTWFVLFVFHDSAEDSLKLGTDDKSNIFWILFKQHDIEFVHTN